MRTKIKSPLLSLSRDYFLKHYWILLFLFLSWIQSGCGILIGNVKPKDEKSDDYTLMDLSKATDDQWRQLKDSLQTDAAYQSQKTHAVIAITSSCRDKPLQPSSTERLRKLSQPLFLGMTNVTYRKERSILVSGRPALETIVLGKENTHSNPPTHLVVLQSVVLQENQCVYKLLSTSTPQAFPDTASTFVHFVNSFQLKSAHG